MLGRQCACHRGVGSAEQGQEEQEQKQQQEQQQEHGQQEEDTEGGQVAATTVLQRVQYVITVLYYSAQRQVVAPAPRPRAPSCSDVLLGLVGLVLSRAAVCSTWDHIRVSTLG